MWTGRNRKTQSQVDREQAEFERVLPLVEAYWLAQAMPAVEAKVLALHVASQVSRSRTLSKCALLDRLVELHGRRPGTWWEYWRIGVSGRFDDEAATSAILDNLPGPNGENCSTQASSWRPSRIGGIFHILRSPITRSDRAPTSPQRPG